MCISPLVQHRTQDSVCCIISDVSIVAYRIAFMPFNLFPFQPSTLLPINMPPRPLAQVEFFPHNSGAAPTPASGCRNCYRGTEALGTVLYRRSCRQKLIVPSVVSFAHLKVCRKADDLIALYQSELANKLVP